MQQSSKMCHFQNRGECRYGRKCWYAHDLETSRQRLIYNTTKRAYREQFARAAENASTNPIDAFLLQLQVQGPFANSTQGTSTLNNVVNATSLILQELRAKLSHNTSTDELIAQVQAYDPFGRQPEITGTNATSTDALISYVRSQEDYAEMIGRPCTTSINALIAQVKAQELHARLSQSTDTDALIAEGLAQDPYAGPAGRTSTNDSATNALMEYARAQEHFARMTEIPSTSATSTDALIAQEFHARLFQSLITSTSDGTDAVIAHLQARELAAMPPQSTSSSTASTDVLIAQLQAQELAAMPSQSTISSTSNTDALIAQVPAQELCAMPSQSTSTSTCNTDASIAQVPAQELKLHPEASMKPILKQPENSKIAIEKVANELSVPMKSGNGNSVKETASNFHSHNQKNMKESTKNDGSVWDDILMSAIDSDLLCNICLEIFIKPTVLNCSHTFCESCILIWINRVVACPICRVQVKSKAYCLTLESFIEKIVEHLPKEIKDKREVTIKERSNIRIERQQRMTHRVSRNSLTGLIYGTNSILTPPQYPIQMDRNVDFNTDVLVDESEIFRMNLHDTVVSTRGVNPLMSYIVNPEEQPSNRRITRPYNTFARH